MSMIDDYDALFDKYNTLKAALAAKETELVQARKLNGFWEDQAGSFEAQLMGASKELAQAREKINSLLSLVDGAKGLVEIYKAVSLAQLGWKEDWLNKARGMLI